MTRASGTLAGTSGPLPAEGFAHGPDAIGERCGHRRRRSHRRSPMPIAGRLVNVVDPRPGEHRGRPRRSIERACRRPRSTTSCSVRCCTAAVTSPATSRSSSALTDVPGLAVQRQCATGMSALTVAAAEIMAGMNRVALAGGAAQMTQSPVSFMKSPYPRTGMERWLSPSHADRPDAPNMNMMVTVGENTARSAGVTRQEMDDWSLGSHRKAIAAIDEGRMAPEIVPVKVAGSRRRTRCSRPTSIRGATRPPRSWLRFGCLSGVPNGTITAGNSSPINDGAAALVVARRDWAPPTAGRARHGPVLGRRRRRPG